MYQVFYTNNQDQVKVETYKTEKTAQQAVFQLRTINLHAFYFSNRDNPLKDKKELSSLSTMSRKYNLIPIEQLQLLNF